jgi:hypothetical protein
MISSFKESQAQFCTDKQHPRRRRRSSSNSRMGHQSILLLLLPLPGSSKDSRRKQLHMTKLEKEVEANGPSVFEFGDWKPGARY